MFNEQAKLPPKKHLKLQQVMQFHLKIVAKYMTAIMKFWVLTATLTTITNKRRQQNSGKVHLKESAKEPSSAIRKTTIIGDSIVKNVKHYQLNRLKSLKDQHVSIKIFPGATIRSISIIFNQR